MKRHQKTHSKGPTPIKQRIVSKVEKEEIIEEEELSSELHIEDEDAAGQLLTEYSGDPLEEERTVRVPAGSRNL